jgi:hypothetical protein
VRRKLSRPLKHRRSEVDGNEVTRGVYAARDSLGHIIEHIMSKQGMRMLSALSKTKLTI